jgi:hypothetical protein
LWLWNFGETELSCLVELFNDDLVTEIDALVTDVYAGTRNEFLYLLLGLATEGALEEIAGFANSRGHGSIVNGKTTGWVDFSTQPVRL